MVIKENQTLFFCEHCKKMYRRKYPCEKHEKWCSKNPRNKHKCFDFCKYLTRNRTDQGTDFYCEKLKKNLHSFIIDKYIEKGNEYAGLLMDVKEDTERMPMECEEHRYECDTDGEREEWISFFD